MNQDVLILGGGLLGAALASVQASRVLARSECDFHDVAFLDAVDAAYAAKPFGVLVNAAAFTQVDAAETMDSGELLRVNAVAPGELAKWCAARGVLFVHFSTDYVFDGSGHVPWKESDTPAPLGAYGMSKLAGERAVMAAGGNTLLFRVSWLYGARGKNFFTRMRQLMAERETVQVVADQVGAPSFAPHVARAVVQAVAAARQKAVFPASIYHLAHSGEVSWHGFARAMLAEERTRNPELMCKAVEPITTKAFGAPAPRPLNSRLNTGHVRDTLGVVLPHWEEGLRACYHDHE